MVGINAGLQPPSLGPQHLWIPVVFNSGNYSAMGQVLGYKNQYSCNLYQ